MAAHRACGAHAALVHALISRSGAAQAACTLTAKLITVPRICSKAWFKTCGFCFTIAGGHRVPSPGTLWVRVPGEGTRCGFARALALQDIVSFFRLSHSRKNGFLRGRQAAPAPP